MEIRARGNLRTGCFGRMVGHTLCVRCAGRSNKLDGKRGGHAFLLAFWVQNMIRVVTGEANGLGRLRVMIAMGWAAL